MSLNHHMRHATITPSTTPSSAASSAIAAVSTQNPGHIDYRQLLANGIGNSDGVTSAASAMTTTAHQLAPRFLVECSVKLHMKPLTSATASVLYHRFFRATSPDDYDAFLVASSCLYLAGKLKDDPVKIRDVINVSHATLNRGASPLELGEEYWTLRDGFVQAELLITRMLKFNLSVVHPHKYLLHFMSTLQDWFGKAAWLAMPIASIAAGFLQDFHSHPAILDYQPAHVACGCLSLAFQTYGVQVPVTDEFDENLVWYNVFAKDLTKELHWELLEKIMDVYNGEQQEAIK